MVETAEMEVENEEIKASDDLTDDQENASANDVEVSENFSSDLEKPMWAVVSYEEIAVSGLTYDEAVKWVEKLKMQNISGLCIVTNEAAARISN